MPAYNFNERFSEKIISGEKLFTIRRRRKRPTRPGDMLILYAGQRTKNCRLLKRAICRSVTPINIHPNAISLNGTVLSTEQEFSFTGADGFEWPHEFYQFFQDKYGLPVLGILEVISWGDWEKILTQRKEANHAN